MNRQLELNFDAPAPGDLRAARRERDLARCRAWYVKNRTSILAKAGWRTDPRNVQIDDIARALGMEHRDILRNMRHLHAPWLSAPCYQLWHWVLREKKRLRNIAKVCAQQKAASTPLPDDPVLEIARYTGVSIRMLRILHTRNDAPLDSLDAFTTWRAGRKLARKIAGNEQGRRNYQANREKRLQQERERTLSWTAEERARRAAYVLRWSMDRYYTDPLYHLQQLLRARLRLAIKHARAKKSDKTIALLGCSWPELEAHLRKKFKRGMTMENMGTKWHIDHIVPVSKFDLAKPEQQKLCFNYTNLQPLWGPENLSKGARFKGTHQFPLLFD